MLSSLKNLIPLDSPIRIIYHKLRAMIAAFVYGFSAGNMIVIAVTGTDGKTTTCNMIEKILSDAGYRVGLLSTVAVSINGQREINDRKMTSFDPFLMNAYLRKMKKAQCQYVVLEVSSHAIFYNRIWGVNIDVAVLTHITSDHLDLHRTVENYVLTKRRLFEQLNASLRKPGIPKVAVLNQDDAYFEDFNEINIDRKYVYSMLSKAQISGQPIELTETSTSFNVEVSEEHQTVTLPFAGKFHISNALAAISACISQNVSVSQCCASLTSFGGVAGRMEKVENSLGIHAIVDYAHTENGLLQVLKSVRESAHGKLYLVFGAPGQRDKSKRVKMGALAAGLADYLIVTDDDPGSEDHISIIDHIREGIPEAEGSNVWSIPDRRSAIRTAMYLAQSNDIVLITGKGCEPVQLTNAGKIPWSDKQVVIDTAQELAGL